MQRLLKKSLKYAGLTLLLAVRNLLPKFLIKRVFSRLTGIILEPYDEESSARNVIVCNYKYGAKAAMCVSVDLDVPEFAARYNWKGALERFPKTAEEYGLPISWGICGELVLQHPETLSFVTRSPEFHDVGVHTFTHRKLSDPSCTEDKALYEIRECKRVLEELGIAKEPVTFIFPWNDVAFADLVQKEGFTVYRGNKTFRLTYPRKVGKLWDVQGTYYLTENSRFEVNSIRKMIDFAMAFGCVFHIWFHPWNALVEGDAERFVEEIFEPLLSYAKLKNERNLLWLCSLRELANYSEARESCRIDSVEYSDNKISFSAYCSISDRRFDSPPTVTIRIEIPSNWHGADVYVDDSRLVNSDPGQLTIKCESGKHLLLTLSFERLHHNIHVERTF
jgi:hypothetical protein